ncbi:hypothetical protein C8F04DRAFT_1182320 [Mycena alexandri]|uniref:Uncharacterized protein n=1 Tax=Mycena alexandri TaxID=1745969 RepID=A0AAD6SYI4_9AGAR|nr:hypothetical protein C8F04DRAFT_1182320 [Mycena alexandri]
MRKVFKVTERAVVGGWWLVVGNKWGIVGRRKPIGQTQRKPPSSFDHHSGSCFWRLGPWPRRQMFPVCHFPRHSKQTPARYERNSEKAQRLACSVPPNLGAHREELSTWNAVVIEITVVRCSSEFIQTLSTPKRPRRCGASTGAVNTPTIQQEAVVLVYTTNAIGVVAQLTSWGAGRRGVPIRAPKSAVGVVWTAEGKGLSPQRGGLGESGEREHGGRATTTRTLTDARAAGVGSVTSRPSAHVRARARKAGLFEGAARAALKHKHTSRHLGRGHGETLAANPNTQAGFRVPFPTRRVGSLAIVSPSLVKGCIATANRQYPLPAKQALTPSGLPVFEFTSRRPLTVLTVFSGTGRGSSRSPRARSSLRTPAADMRRSSAMVPKISSGTTTSFRLHSLAPYERARIPASHVKPVSSLIVTNREPLDRAEDAPPPPTPYPSSPSQVHPQLFLSQCDAWTM